MPRNVRPSWVDLRVDGRVNDIGTGPRTRDGSMEAQFYVRDHGSVKHKATIRFLADRAGNTTEISIYVDGDLLHSERVTQ